MNKPARPVRRAGLRAWLDARTGYQAGVKEALDFPVRGGASWAYVYGAMLLFVLVNQALTGMLLAAFYAPSATTAWTSVAYIQDQLPLGWFVRGLHSLGASLMVVTLILHLVQVTLYGAYRKPREVTWFTGLLLAGLVFAFALTGYLLPWDQKGYWATQVVTTLIGATPLIGPPLQVLLQGGTRYGHLTVTHFYALHVVVLPAVVLGLVGLHVWLFRRHGVTPRWGRGERDVGRRTEPYWPGQAVRDLFAVALLLIFMVAWVARTHGADLSAPADPTAAYDARPEWYYLPLYQMLKYFPGPLEVLAAMLGPLCAFGLLCALPFWDRATDNSPGQRRGPLLAGAVLVLTAMGLGGAAYLEDAADVRFARNQSAAEREAVRARELARKGVLPAGGTAVYRNDPSEEGRQLFAEHCAGCHRLGAQGPAAEQDVKGPDLTRFGSRSWLSRFLRDPDAPAFFGRTVIHGMKAVTAPEPELLALVEFMYSQSGPEDVDAGLAQRGRTLFTEHNCDSCHEMDGKTEGEGPNLHGHASVAWVRGVLQNAASPLYFGDKDDMPSFRNKLSPEELEELAAFVASQRDTTP